MLCPAYFHKTSFFHFHCWFSKTLFGRGICIVFPSSEILNEGASLNKFSNCSVLKDVLIGLPLVFSLIFKLDPTKLVIIPWLSTTQGYFDSNKNTFAWILVLRHLNSYIFLPNDKLYAL